MRFSAAAIVAAAFAGVANAYTQPVGANPEGNPISAPALGQQVEEGKPFTITWEATTPTTGTVTLVLVHGPSTNVKPMYPIAESIPNTGSYTWTPKGDLKPESTHYGIQLIVDANGQYQYTPQFGIVKGSGSASPSDDCTTTTPAAETTSCTDEVPIVTPLPDTTCTDEIPMTTPYTYTKHHKSETAPYPESTTKEHHHWGTGVVTVTVTAPCACETKKHHHTTMATPIVPYPANNATTPCPSSASLVTIPTATTPAATSSPPIHTGAAGKNAVAAGAVVLGAIAVAMGL